MQDNLNNYSKLLLEFHLPRWEELPDFDLYSDQVIQLISNYLNILGDSNVITSSMINNYVKHNMIPKPNGKKYQKIHLAYLIAITLLKQVLSINNINLAITYQSDISGLKDAYNLLCIETERCLNNVSHQLSGNYALIDINIPDNTKALNFATNALAYKLVADKIVELNTIERG